MEGFATFAKLSSGEESIWPTQVRKQVHILPQHPSVHNLPSRSWLPPVSDYENELANSYSCPSVRIWIYGQGLIWQDATLSLTYNRTCASFDNGSFLGCPAARWRWVVFRSVLSRSSNDSE